jgi:hypothetical protein
MMLICPLSPRPAAGKRLRTVCVSIHFVTRIGPVLEVKKNPIAVSSGPVFDQLAEYIRRFTF